jgi:DHA2 family multidrug resistance protein
MERGLLTGSKLGITVAVMLAAMMAVLDVSIVNVALNDIRASFGTPLDQIAWVSTGYMMANVVIIPMSGWLQRRFGFRRYYVASILIFGMASALCGASWNLPSLVAFRVLQGLGGGAIIPTSQSILFAVASWHWIFLINVPAVLVAATLAHYSLEEPGYVPSDERVDSTGIALLVVGMASLQYVLEEGNRDGWFESRTILVFSVAAVVAVVTFIVHELETPNPVVDLRIFANRSYTAATGLNFAVGMTLFSASFLYSLYCGTVMHYTALDIGMLFLKGSAIQLLLLPIIGMLLSRVDPRPLIVLGGLTLTASVWVNGHLNQMADEHAMLVPVFIRACGLGFIFAPLNVTALSDVPADRRGNAAGLFNLTRELGGSIGTAWMSTMLDRNVKQHLTSLASHVSLFDLSTQLELASIQRTLFGRVSDARGAAVGVLGLRQTTQALVGAFNHGFLVLAVVFMGAVGLVGLLHRPRGTRAAPAAH